MPSSTSISSSSLSWSGSGVPADAATAPRSAVRPAAPGSGAASAAAQGSEERSRTPTPPNAGGPVDTALIIESGSPNGSTTSSFFTSSSPPAGSPPPVPVTRGLAGPPQPTPPTTADRPLPVPAALNAAASLSEENGDATAQGTLDADEGSDSSGESGHEGPNAMSMLTMSISSTSTSVEDGDAAGRAGNDHTNLGVGVGDPEAGRDPQAVEVQPTEAQQTWAAFRRDALIFQGAALVADVLWHGLTSGGWDQAYNAGVSYGGFAVGLGGNWLADHPTLRRHRKLSAGVRYTVPTASVLASAALNPVPLAVNGIAGGAWSLAHTLGARGWGRTVAMFVMGLGAQIAANAAGAKHALMCAPGASAGSPAQGMRDNRCAFDTWWSKIAQWTRSSKTGCIGDHCTSQPPGTPEWPPPNVQAACTTTLRFNAAPAGSPQGFGGSLDLQQTCERQARDGGVVVTSLHCHGGHGWGDGAATRVEVAPWYIPAKAGSVVPPSQNATPAEVRSTATAGAPSLGQQLDQLAQALNQTGAPGPANPWAPRDNERLAHQTAACFVRLGYERLAHDGPKADGHSYGPFIRQDIAHLGSELRAHPSARGWLASMLQHAGNLARRYAKDICKLGHGWSAATTAQFDAGAGAVCSHSSSATQATIAGGFALPAGQANDVGAAANQVFDYWNEAPVAALQPTSDAAALAPLGSLRTSVAVEQTLQNLAARAALAGDQVLPGTHVKLSQVASSATAAQRASARHEALATYTALAMGRGPGGHGASAGTERLSLAELIAQQTQRLVGSAPFWAQLRGFLSLVAPVGA